MKEYAVILMAIAIQFAAAFFAMRLCWITEKKTSWIFIAVAMFFMGLRRCMRFYQCLSQGSCLDLFQVTEEITTLIISISMLAGVASIAPLFYAIKDSEENLKQSEEKYRTLVNTIPAVVFTGFADGTVDFFDEKITEVTGYEKEVFTSRRLKWQDIILEEDLQESKKALIKLLGTTGSYIREYRIRHKGGNIIWIQERSHVVCDLYGNIEYINGLFYDITDRKLIEEQLQKIKGRLQFLISSTPASIYSCKTCGDFGATFVSDNITLLLGYKPQEFIEDSSFWVNRIHPDDITRVSAELPKLLEQGHHSYEYRFLHQDGTYRWMHDEMRLIPDEVGQPLEIVGYWMDITDRKRSEELLRESEVRFRTTFEGAPIGIALLNLQGRLLESNRILQNLLGYTWEELDLKVFSEIAHPEERAKCLNLFSELISGKSDFFEIEDHRCLRKDGSLLWGRLHMSLVKDAAGLPQFAIGMIVDITRQKQAELEIRAYQQRLRSLSSELTLIEERERRRLASELHENIGQILAIAQIKLGVLLSEAPSPNFISELAEVREHIGKCIQYTRSLTFKISPPVLYGLGFEDAIQWLANQTTDKSDIAVTVQSEQAPSPPSEEARVLLFLAIRELLNNVAKHSQAHHAKITIGRHGKDLRLQLEDDGIGFDPSKSESTGFGLFTIREHLDRIGGVLEIRSKPGHGTLVTLSVPWDSKNS